MPACDGSGSSVDENHNVAPEPIGCSDGQWPLDLPALTIGGVEGRAIDVESLDADVVFNTAAERATVVANLSFQANVEGGPPIFGLRQAISAAYLDGEEVDPARVKTEDLGGTIGPLSVLDTELDPCSRHVLSFEYELATPDKSDATT